MCIHVNLPNHTCYRGECPRCIYDRDQVEANMLRALLRQIMPYCEGTNLTVPEQLFALIREALKEPDAQ